MRRFVAAAAGLALIGSTITAASAAYAYPHQQTRHHDQQRHDQQLRPFQRTATYPVYLNNGDDSSQETVSEISAVTPDGRTLIYTDSVNKQIGFVDISDPHAPAGQGTLSLVRSGDADDEPTSVAVHGNYALVVINTSASHSNPSGRIDIIRLSDRQRVRSIALPGQPDSIAVAPNGRTAAIAIENERDEDVNNGDLPQSPAGQITFLTNLGNKNPSAWVSKDVDFADQLTDVPGIDTPQDPEPEYEAYSPDSSKVALTLQENNGIVIFDPNTGKLIKAFSAGLDTVRNVDTTDDDNINPTGTIKDVPREPDAIAWLDSKHVATANEGDWKGGSRGWSVFDSRSGKLVWDAGNSFEMQAIKDGLYPESRADKKGTEPEGLAYAQYHGTPYVFVASERGNFAQVFDVKKPTKPRYVQTLPTTNGPEGVLPIPGRNLIAFSSETDDPDNRVRASISLYQYAPGRHATAASFPTITSQRVNGTPIPYSALGALTADVRHPNRIYTVTDAAFTPTRILGIDTSRKPALIDSQLTVTKDGKPYGLDAEGIYQRPDGSFWIADEGATGAENRLVKISSTGAVEQEIPLPDAVGNALDKWGLEGVTARYVHGREEVYVAVQRELSTDPKGTVRIGRYLPSTKSWTWFGYQLDTTTVDGDWLGLSEIAYVGDNKLAVIERDKLNGPDARIKRLYTVTIPSTQAGTPDQTSITATLPKTLAYDVLPQLRKTNGWTQEKLEGMTIGGNGQVYAITDNDALQDATGETVFLRLGSRRQVFGR